MSIRSSRTSPSELLTSEPATTWLVGGHKRLQEPHLPGLRAGHVANGVFDLLRADVSFCNSVSTVEQAAAEQGVTPSELTGRVARWLGDSKTDYVAPTFDAAWSGSPEERQQAERIASNTEQLKRKLWGNL